MQSPPSRGASLFIAIISLAVIAYTVEYVGKALDSGSVPGKLGTIYHAPDFHFYAFIGLAGVGTLFGITLLIMSARWLFRR